MTDVNPEKFNQLVSTMLALYSEFIGIEKSQIGTKIIQFNNQLDNQISQLNEKLVQQRQDDVTPVESI